MGNMNVLAHPVEDYTRMDGRRVLTTDELDLRGEDPGRHTTGDQAYILTPGLVVGALVRWHYVLRLPPREIYEDEYPYTHHSTRIHLWAEHNGDFTDMRIRLSRWHPHLVSRPTPVPLFDVNIWRDAYGKHPIGTMAIAILKERRRIIASNPDHRAIKRVMGIEGRMLPRRSYLGAVQEGGLYVVPPLPPENA